MNESYILFDIPDGKEPDGKEFLEGLGHRVMVCGGPEPRQLCPILKGERCRLAEDAAGVVFELDLDRPQHRAILARYRDKLSSDIPLHVVASSDQVDKYGDLLKGLKVWRSSPRAGDLDAVAAEVEAVNR